MPVLCQGDEDTSVAAEGLQYPQRAAIADELAQELDIFCLRFGAVVYLGDAVIYVIGFETACPRHVFLTALLF